MRHFHQKSKLAEIAKVAKIHFFLKVKKFMQKRVKMFYTILREKNILLKNSLAFLQLCFHFSERKRLQRKFFKIKM